MKNDSLVKILTATRQQVKKVKTDKTEKE